jgi:hypothetical protein
MGGRQARQPRPHDNHIRIHNPVPSHDSSATPHQALPHQTNPALPHLSVVPLPSPRTLQLQYTTAVRRGADRTAEGHLQLSGAAVAGSRQDLLLLSCPDCGWPARRLPGAASRQHPSGRALVAVVGMPGCLPAAHRRSVSTIGCPPNPARRPGPGVQPSGVRPVQCPVIWLPGPDAAVRPAGVQPVPASSRLVAVRPPGRSRLVPRPPGGGDGGDLATAGSGHD